jgi:hypothetical protein
MYGSVLSGGLSGHVHGTAAYDITATGEPEGMRPHVWEAFKYESANYMKHLEKFILSEGKKYQNLQPDRVDIEPNKAPGSPGDGLDGWSYMMRTPGKDFALLYFENKSALPVLKNFKPNSSYTLQWFNTITGDWSEEILLNSDSKGKLILPQFPDKQNSSFNDWAAKIILSE